MYNVIDEVNIIDKIKKQTKKMSKQLKKLDEIPEDDDEKYIKELEKYHSMIKKADFSPESQAASNKKLTLADKIFAPKINKVTKMVNKANEKLIEHNEKVKHETK